MRLAITDDVSVGWRELQFKATKSRGPGGQNVNKTATRMELYFDVKSSPSFTEEQRAAIMEHLGPKLDSKGVLRIVSQEWREQWRNKEAVLFKFVILLSEALTPPKPRKRTKPTARSRQERLQSKKAHGAKKRERRRKPDDEA